MLSLTTAQKAAFNAQARQVIWEAEIISEASIQIYGAGSTGNHISNISTLYDGDGTLDRFAVWESGLFPLDGSVMLISENRLSDTAHQGGLYAPFTFNSSGNWPYTTNIFRLDFANPPIQISVVWVAFGEKVVTDFDIQYLDSDHSTLLDTVQVRGNTEREVYVAHSIACGSIGFVPVAGEPGTRFRLLECSPVTGFRFNQGNALSMDIAYETDFFSERVCPNSLQLRIKNFFSGLDALQSIRDGTDFPQGRARHCPDRSQRPDAGRDLVRHGQLLYR